MDRYFSYEAFEGWVGVPLRERTMSFLGGQGCEGGVRGVGVRDVVG